MTVERPTDEHVDVEPEPAKLRIARRRPIGDIESTEIVRGTKPGSRYARRIRAAERRFEQVQGDDGTVRATTVATAPRTAPQRAWRRLRRVAFGSPLASEEADQQKLPKWKALAVFSSDVLSSSAYATDEILLVLAAAGVGALVHSVEIAVAIVLLLAIVTFSYRQTIRAYPTGGGAYIVARENLGDAPGLTAAAALAVDYVLTVSVSIAAGVLAIASAFPELHAYAVELAVGFVALITLLNLRGVRESATIFALPTYAFIASIVLLLIAGYLRLAIDPGLQAETPDSVHAAGTSGLTVFLILRAFSSGCAALTGTEAISNGVPAFRRPEAHNASATLLWMGLILGSFFLGITVLAREFGVQHADDISVPAQLAKTVFGESPLFYVIQASTALILLLAANTAYADFPRLGSILAKDRFLPHTFTFRGDRLAFSNGIIVLGVTSSFLLIVFDADVSKLIPLYAFGVFVSFTLSQGGMVVHWLRIRDEGWRRSAVISAVGAAATAIVAVIVGMTKFIDGAWISMLAMGILALVFYAIHAHYREVEKALAIEGALPSGGRRSRDHIVIVPVEEMNRAVIQTMDYARAISPQVTALHVTDDPAAGADLRRTWDGIFVDVPLLIIDSPYRSFVAPVIAYMDALAKPETDPLITVVLPEFRTRWPWHRWLHNQSTRRLRAALLDRPNTGLCELPISMEPR